MTETTHLGLPYLAAAQAQKHVTHNEALLRLDAVVQLAVIDASHTAPPGSPAQGDRYIIGHAATGDWAGHDGDIAAFIDGAWLLVAPGPGWIAFDVAAGAMLVRHDDSWVPLGGHLGAIDRLGVNTTADDTTRLAVRSGAVLMTAVAVADGGSGDVRCVLNKESDGDTASLLFQRDYSGRAEIGLAGDTDFVFKVSADGAAWTEAIRIDKTSGRATLAADPGSAMQAATKQYVDQIVAAQDAMVFKGVVDCSASPDYPAADRGHTYRVSVAGKIGGGSGVAVEAGDLLLSLADGTASGNQATVGAHWSVAQANLDGAVIGPASATNGVPVLFDGTTGKLIKATTFSAFKSALALGKADVGLGSVLDVPQREKLVANRTYYVRTDGSDGNTGLANTSGGAFLTLQKAMDVVAELDLGIYNVTINVAAGTYAGALTLKTVLGAGTVTFVGDATTPGNVVVSPASGSAVVSNAVGGAAFVINGFKLAGGTGPDLYVASACRVTCTNIEWAGTSNFRIFCNNYGTVTLAGSGHKVSGGGIGFLRAESMGNIYASSITLTFLANVTYSSSFASVYQLGLIFAPLITFTLGAFTVTGTRYVASANGVISIAGGGANYFPGTAAGLTTAGGQYV